MNSGLEESRDQKIEGIGGLSRSLDGRHYLALDES